MKKKYIIISIICLVLGFFIGRQTVSTEAKIKYIQGKAISGSVNDSRLIPIKEEKQTNPNLPLKPEIIYKDSIRYIVLKVDTAAIIADYILKRSYELTPFDDENGKLQLFPTVQYNQLTGLDYQFTPIRKEIIQQKEKLWQPFVSVSYSTLDFIGIGGGVFYQNLGIEYQYQKGITNNGHLLGLKYKF